MGAYAKAIAALLQAIVLGLQTYYPSAKWVIVVTAAVGAALVYLVPNIPSSKDSSKSGQGQQNG